MEPTEVQRHIIDNPGNTVVLASPGSGKTFVLSRKIRNALSRDDIQSYQGVIAISYTRKASAHLKTRTLGEGLYEKNSFFGTIDNFCLTQIIIPFGSYLFGNPPKELDIININDLPKNQQSLFEWIREIHPDFNNVQSSQIDDISNLFQLGYLLIESLELIGLYLIRNCVACQKYLKARFKYVFIDEYQDADTYTHDIFISLISLGMKGIVVGDVNQSIYGFAHKHSRFLTELESNPNFTTFKLAQNFRCSVPIVNYSNRLLDSNSSLLETDEDGVILARIEGDETDTAAYIDNHISEICSSLKIENLSDVAILVKNGRTQKIINTSLSTKHRLVETTTLDMDLNPRSHLYAQLLSYYFDNKATFFSILDEYVDYENLNNSFKKKLNSLKNLIRSIEIEHINKLTTLFQQIANILLPKIPERESLDKLNEVFCNPQMLNSYLPVKKDEIQLMTLHKSKGLEFDLVFHLNMSDWELPYKKINNNDFNNPEYPTWEQDLNLHYVGITRAKKACILVRGTLRTNSYDQLKKANDSEFLSLNNLDLLRKEINIPK
ncbi:MAG: ATP-dependent helicase [Muribaculaceae bacterium]|nr:ATP-dependent helicase [Muribaculaceae bacterium]